MQSDANKTPESPLSPKQEIVALHLAQAELSQNDIAKREDVAVSTIWRWRKDEVFAARVAELAGEFREAIRSYGISILENRVAAAQHRWEKMKRVIEARAEKYADVPGGNTGLLVHNVKSIGAGVTAERVDLYEFDAALVKELREHERQIAEELGQWKQEWDDSGSEVLIQMRTVKQNASTPPGSGNETGPVQPTPGTGGVS